MSSNVKKRAFVDNAEMSRDNSDLVEQDQWADFLQQINFIDDKKGSSNAFQSAQLPSCCSEIFHKVMTDFKTRLAEQRAAALAAAEAAREAARKAKEEEEIQEEEEELEDEDIELALSELHFSDEDEDDDHNNEDLIHPVRQAALRGWSIIRRNIQEVAMERRKKHATFNWSFLRQHISNMSDHEKAREELYEKYLYKPSSWADGLVNAHLLIKARTNSQLTRRVPSRAATSHGMASRKVITESTLRPRSQPHLNIVARNNRFPSRAANKR